MRRPYRGVNITVYGSMGQRASGPAPASLLTTKDVDRIIRDVYSGRDGWMLVQALRRFPAMESAGTTSRHAGRLADEDGCQLQRQASSITTDLRRPRVNL